MIRRLRPLAAVLGAALLLSACTGGSPAASTGSSSGAPSGAAATGSESGSGAGSVAASGTADPLPAPPGNPAGLPGVPTDDAHIARAIDQVDAIAQDAMDRSGLPGMAVAVVHGGKIVFAKGYGVREVGRPGAVDADTSFQLASVSKPIGATVVAAEVGKGTVDWTTPVVDHLSGFTLADPGVTQNVTIADLYAHRSGLPNHAGDDLEDLGYDQQQIFDRLKYLPLNPLRAVYNYTNFGMTAGAESVAAAAGTAWSTLSSRDLYAPLGMSTTSSDFAAFQANPNHAVLHAPIDGGGYAATYVRDPDNQSPAGGVSGSATDVAKWMALVLAGGKAPDGTQLVDDAALRTALTPVIRSADGSPTPEQIDARAGFYGEGIGVSNDATGRVRLTHSGAFSSGAGTTVMMIPALDLGIVVLTNGTANGTAESVTASFADVAEYGAVQYDWLTAFQNAFVAINAPQGELVGQTPPAAAAPAAATSAYVGTYQNDYFGPITIGESGGGLVLTAGPKQVQYQLTHWDGPTFTFDPVGNRGTEPGGENVADGSISEVTFTMTGDSASSVTVEQWNKNGLGTFTR
ncbi:serine hydrolase [Nakamurella sp.]|uniref:serine hydrolase n=1 Tax=Nakamurella sp. TaxID=1869182 RepID=UPI0037835990